MSFRIVIPARHGAQRLPGKPLREIAGRPLIEHVWRRAREAGAREVVVATDDTRIADAVRRFGGTVEMTAPELPSGTDRCAAVAEARGWDEDEVVVNLQGDEPLMPPRVLRQVADLLAADPAAAIATLCLPLTSLAEFLDPNVVKVVASEDGAALYFSRAPIPWDRDAGSGGPTTTPGVIPVPVIQSSHRSACRHLGLYAYRVGALLRLTATPPCELERIEKLEQLRALWCGMRIRVETACEPVGTGVDTPEDLARVATLITQLESDG